MLYFRNGDGPMLREIEYILAIEKYRNISKAAAALYVSQPTLSRFLNTYEDLLGLKLFERHGNKYLLTYAGERFISYAKQLATINNNLNAELADIVSDQKGRLAIGYQINRSSQMVPRTIPKFHELYPQVRIVLKEASSKELEQMLLDGIIDIVIYNYVPHHPALSYEILTQEEFLLIVPKNHHLVSEGKYYPDLKYPLIDLKLFENEPFIMQEEDQASGQLARQILLEIGIDPPVILRTRSIAGGIQLVSQGFGCGFVASSHLDSLTSSLDIQAFCIERPNRKMDLVVARRSSNYLSKYAKAYIDIVSGLFQK